MRINRGLLGWGLFLIVLGGMVLAVRQGYVSTELAAQAWRLWPVLLIVAGLGLVLRRTPIEPLSGLASSVTFGVIVGGLLASGAVPFQACGDAEGARRFEHRSGELVGPAQVNVAMSCGEVTIRTADGAGWSIEGSDDEGRGPIVAASPNTLEIDTNRVFAPATARARWDVTLPRGVPMDVELTTNAGRLTVDLAGAQLGKVEVVVNAGETRLDLAGAAALRELEVQLNAVGAAQIVLPPLAFDGSIRGNAAGDIVICPPAGVGLRLVAGSSVASSNNFDERGLVEVNGGWQTTDYDTAATRITLDTQANAGSFRLEVAGACDA